MMQKCMVLKQRQRIYKRFENDVEMYGAQTYYRMTDHLCQFENDVEMYGAQTVDYVSYYTTQFENDVEMYGAQTSSFT